MRREYARGTTLVALGGLGKRWRAHASPDIGGGRDAQRDRNGALQNGFDALFTTAAELIDELSLASREGRMRDALAPYLPPHVLVVDEVGYLSYGADAANVLYHVVNERHIRRRAVVFTTNKHPKRWGEVLHDDDLADAIVDRILERGRLLRLDGPSVRTKHIPADELAGGDQADPGNRRVSGIHAAEFPERTRLDGDSNAQMEMFVS